MWKDSGKNNISILHSNLGDRRRYEEWNRIKRGEARIVIGTRSGIFAPIENVGVIVIDEEHDMSYQSDNIPKYDAIPITHIRKITPMIVKMPLIIFLITILPFYLNLSLYIKYIINIIHFSTK